MNPIILHQFGKRKALGNRIEGSTGTSTPNQTFTGTINIVTATYLRISVFGGGCGSGITTNGYVTITSPYNSYPVNSSAYTTVTRDIWLTPGTYPYYGSFSMASGATWCGNNISIKLL